MQFRYKRINVRGKNEAWLNTDRHIPASNICFTEKASVTFLLLYLEGKRNIYIYITYKMVLRTNFYRIKYELFFTTTTVPPKNHLDTLINN